MPRLPALTYPLDRAPIVASPRSIRQRHRARAAQMATTTATAPALAMRFAESIWVTSASEIVRSMRHGLPT